MAFTSEVKARLSLDTTPFSRALTKATADLGAAGDDMQRKLKRSFGAGDVFKGLLQGLGIGSVQAVVDKLVGGYERAAEQAKTLAETTARTLGLYQAIYASRRTDEQNLAANLREQARLQKQLAGTTEQSEMRTMYGPGGAYQARFVTRQANPERAAEIAQELAQLAKEEEEIRGKIKKTAEETRKEDAKRADELQKAREELAAQEAANATKQQTINQQIADLEEQRANLRATIALSGDEDLTKSREVAKISGKILDLEKQRADEAKRAADETERYQKRLADAQSALANSIRVADDAFEERSALTLQEVASGKYQSSSQQRGRAREIMRLEEKAKRQRAQGFTAEAFETTSRAVAMRQSMDELNKSERDPLGESKDAIEKSEKHLDEIRASLKVVQPGGGNTK